MAKKRFSPSKDISKRTFTINEKTVDVEFRYSLRRRSTSLRYGKNGFICNTNPHFKKEEIDAFVVKSVPKLLKKMEDKPNPIINDDVYIFGQLTHVDGFSTWSKEKKNRYLRDNLLPYVAEKTSYYQSIMGVDTNYIVKVREAHTVYGVNHKAKKSITFALSLVHYDKHTIDSVIIHELAHHFVLGHGQKFYRIVLKAAPDYWESRKKLIRNIYG